MSEVNKKLGTLLKEERERQNIKIEDLSERLKITVSNLQAIEGGTTKGLPSELYFSLFAKSYAEAIGIDYVRTFEAIKIDTNDLNEKPEKSKKKNNTKETDSSDENETEDESQFIKKAGIALAIIIGLFVIFLGVNKFFLGSSDSIISIDPATEAQSNVESEESKKIEEDFNNYNWDNNEYTKPSKIVLTLIPRQESWSAVFADGDTAIYRTLRVGRTYTAEADFRMTISVGVPSVVTIKLNGQEVDLRDKESRRIFKVKIDQMNINKYLNRNSDSAVKTETKTKLTQSDNTDQPVASTETPASIEDSETN